MAWSKARKKKHRDNIQRLREARAERKCEAEQILQIFGRLFEVEEFGRVSQEDNLAQVAYWLTHIIRHHGNIQGDDFFHDLEMWLERHYGCEGPGRY